MHRDHHIGRKGAHGRGAPLSILAARCVVFLVLVATVSFAGPQDPAAPESAREDPLDALGFRVTGGAAPGYIEDRACALCHNDLWTSYQEVGMARSFSRPRQEVLVESFGDDGWSEPYFHQPSRRWYRMRWKDGTMTFRRWQENGEGRPVHVLEQKVDWIVGSGHTSRVYLYQTKEGELYQLPLAWYTQNQRGEVEEGAGHWGMAPGFDRSDHLGIERLVHRECMFCHNAYPDVSAGSDLYGQPHVFPAELPEGLGCQRCHGPGAEHVRTAFGGGDAPGNAQDAEPDADQLAQALRASIVNPGRLSDELRNDVCFECHLQPTVAVHGVRRFGRPDYSFRPGEPLSDYLVKVDIDEADRTREERFEINHHAYRLRQSRCFLETQGLESQGKSGALSCLTCHDPHRKVPKPERLEHYRAACLSCHEIDACQLDAMLEETGAPPGLTDVEPRDCVTCHMPRRRTQDVVHVVMTDHRIQRRAPGPERLAPLAEKDPILTGIEVLEPKGELAGPLGEVYRTVSLLRTGSTDPQAVRHLEQTLKQARPDGITPYLDLARGQLQARRLSDAEATLTSILGKEPDNVRALSWMGIVQAGLGERKAALDWTRKALEKNPQRAESHFNLGRLLLGYGRSAEAMPSLERALELRPNLVTAWFHLGQALAAEGQTSKAEAAYRRTLELDPAHERARAALGLDRDPRPPESPPPRAAEPLDP